MSRNLLLLVATALLLGGCSLITRADPPVERVQPDGDGDADADSDGDEDRPPLDGDHDGPDGDIDEDRPPLCTLEFATVHSFLRADGSALSLEFEDFDGDFLPEAVVSGVMGESVGFSTMYRTVLTERGHVYDSFSSIVSRPDQKITSAQIGEFDVEPERELLLFTERGSDSKGEVLIVDSAHSTPLVTPPDAGIELADHGLKDGVIMQFDSTDDRADIVALAWDQGSRQGYIYYWARDSDSSVWRDEPPGATLISGGQPNLLLPVNMDGSRDDELVVAVHEPSRLHLYDWNEEDWRLEQVSSRDLDGCTPLGMVAGDIDGDLRPEILLACGVDELYIVYTDRLALIDDGHADFIGEQDVYALALGDLDGNGTLDLITHDQQDISVFCGDGTGDFEYVMELSSGVDETATPLIAIVDVNHDGRPDVVEINGGEFGGNISTYLAVTED